MSPRAGYVSGQNDTGEEKKAKDETWMMSLTVTLPQSLYAVVIELAVQVVVLIGVGK